MFIEVSSKWEDLHNLAHETPEYEARRTADDYTDDQILIGHWREIAENEARDYDTKKTTRDKYYNQGNQVEVAKWDKELTQHDTKIKELDQIRERIKRDIKRRISGTPDPVLAPPVEIIKPCPCDVSKLEKLINEKINNIKFPIFNYQPIYDALNKLTFPTIENIREIIKEELANNNPQLIKILPVVKPEAVKQSEPVKETTKEPAPKTETAEEFQRAILQNAINERIKKEEAEKKEVELTKEEKIADKIFNDDKNITSNDNEKTIFYNSISDFKNNFETNSKSETTSFLLYKCKNGRWGIVSSYKGRINGINWLCLLVI